MDDGLVATRVQPDLAARIKVARDEMQAETRLATVSRSDAYRKLLELGLRVWESQRTRRRGPG